MAYIYTVFRMDYRTVGYRTVGLSDCRTIGLSDYSYGPLINTAGKLFHVRIAEGKYEFWWHCILEIGI